jgi:hypothetical protein
LKKKIIKRIIKHENLKKYTKKYKGNNPNLTKKQHATQEEKKVFFSPLQASHRLYNNKKLDLQHKKQKNKHLFLLPNFTPLL